MYTAVRGRVQLWIEQRQGGGTSSLLLVRIIISIISIRTISVGHRLTSAKLFAEPVQSLMTMSDVKIPQKGCAVETGCRDLCDVIY